MGGKKSIKVLYVLPKADRPNSLVFVKRQLAALGKKGVEVHTAMLPTGTSPRRIAGNLKDLCIQIRALKPDIVHAQYGSATAMVAALAAGSIPLVVTYRGSDLNPGRRIHKWKNFIARILSQLAALKASGIIAVSRELADRLWWKRRSAVIIPSGIDTDLFYPRPRDQSRRALGWGADERIVIFNEGGRSDSKRTDLASAGVEVARGKVGDIRFVILDGSLEPDMVPVALSAADCLVFTSDREGSPNMIKEAMACDLPIVSVDVGDVVERLAEVEPSRIVTRDPEKIGGAIAEILLNAGRSNGFEIVRRDLSQEVTAGKIVEVYNTVLSINDL